MSCQAGANGQSCAVYRTFFEQLPARERQAFDRRSQPDILAVHRVEVATPRRFERGNGLMAPDPNAPPQFFGADTSQYFGRVSSEPAVDLSSCFQSETPRFVNTPDEALALVPKANSDILAVWSLSSVAISPDGQHALMVGGMLCGGLCGSGAYYLFEKAGEKWTLVGHHDLWIS